MQRTLFGKLALLLVLIGALALAGCGGDDGLSAEDQARIDAAEAAAEQAAAEKAAAEEAARLAAEQAAAEAAARKAAEEAAAKAAEEAAAKAAEEKAAAEEAARKAAEEKAAAEAAAKEAAEEAERQRMAAISAAQMTLSEAKAALAALADDATYEQKRDAQRMVEAAANNLRDVLRMNGGTTAEIDAAVGEAVTAKNAADALQAMITAKAEAAEAARLAAINTAQTALSDAETALMELAEDATDQEKYDAQRAVQRAAAALIQALMDNGGTADQITAATMKQDSAKMMADDLASQIAIAGQRMAIADAISAAMTAVAAVMDDSTDDVVTAADTAVAAATAAIAAATGIPETERAANTGTVAALTAQLATAKSSRQMAMDAAAQAQRMANIASARGMLSGAKDALAALGDDASDEEMRDAYRMIEAAANELRNVLQMNGGTTTDIEAAIREAQTAKIKADALQATITANAEAAEQARLTAINNAQTALSNAEKALADLADDATDADKREAQRAVETAADNLITVLMANGGTADQIAAATTKRDSAKTMADALTSPIEIAAQRKAITDAIAAAMTAVGAVDNDATDAEVKAADDAIAAARMAIADADELSEAEKAGHTMAVNAHATALETAKTRRTVAMAAADEAEKKANTAKGKALKAALGDDPLGHLSGDAEIPLATIGASGLVLGMSNADNTDVVAGQAMMAVKGSEGMLGDWKSMKYAHTDTGTRVTNEAMVYTNRAAPTRKSFATGATQADTDGGSFTLVTDAPDALWDYNSTTRVLHLGTDLAGGDNIAGDNFPTAGTKNYTPTAPSNETIIQGTYQGASGSYRCTGATCGATATAGGGITLAGVWTFTHDVGAMVSIADSTYVFFGWWLKSDKDGPTMASAFTGVIPSAATGITVSGLDAVTGSATYTGKAAGKWAISHPINGGDAGHFTADATLTAKFGTGAGMGVTGTINNFMANEKAVPWSVALNNRTLATNNTDAASNLSATGGITSPNDPDTADVDESKTTVWSIDGNSAAASGTWSGQMYDEMPGNAPTGDGSNIPTTVIGRFQSHFGSDHTMVGAFGAETKP